MKILHGNFIWKFYMEILYGNFIWNLTWKFYMELNMNKTIMRF